VLPDGEGALTPFVLDKPHLVLKNPALPVNLNSGSSLNVNNLEISMLRTVGVDDHFQCTVSENLAIRHNFVNT